MRKLFKGGNYSRADTIWGNTVAFAENAFLLTHLKNRHRSTVFKALKPHFSCGACPAKFFKNSFLVKHSECHGFNPSMQKLRQWYTYITDFDLILKEWKQNPIKFICNQIHYLGSVNFCSVSKTTSIFVSLVVEF